MNGGQAKGGAAKSALMPARKMLNSMVLDSVVKAVKRKVPPATLLPFKVANPTH